MASSPSAATLINLGGPHHIMKSSCQKSMRLRQKRILQCSFFVSNSSLAPALILVNCKNSQGCLWKRVTRVVHKNKPLVPESPTTGFLDMIWVTKVGKSAGGRMAEVVAKSSSCLQLLSELYITSPNPQLSNDSLHRKLGCFLHKLGCFLH